MEPITDLGNFVRCIRSLLDAWGQPNADWYPVLWFRGQQDVTWSLRPGWYRLPTSRGGIGDDWYNETTLFQEFRHRAPQYLDAMPSSDWEWLFLMQHYGLPTRLLDWTQSSLTALYFALRDNRGDNDAAVWVLNPWWLNKQTLGTFDLPYTGDPCLQEWVSYSGTPAVRSACPVAMKPIHSNSRIAAQRGLFTIRGSDPDGLDRLATCSDDQGPQMRKLTISGEYLWEIRRDLAMAGVTETSIFHELEGLCREIKTWFCGL